MWKSIAVVLGLSLVGCVDGEEAPVEVTAPAAPPARALAARQMPTLPSLPELPSEPATSDPWAPNYKGVANIEVDPEEEAAIQKQYAESEGGNEYYEAPLDEHDYENEGAGEHYFHDDPADCPEGCGEEPGYERDYVRDEANDPVNLEADGEVMPEDAGPACEDCD